MEDTTSENSYIRGNWWHWRGDGPPLLSTSSRHHWIMQRGKGGDVLSCMWGHSRTAGTLLHACLVHKPRNDRCLRCVILAIPLGFLFRRWKNCTGLKGRWWSLLWTHPEDRVLLLCSTAGRVCSDADKKSSSPRCQSVHRLQQYRCQPMAGTGWAHGVLRGGLRGWRRGQRDGDGSCLERPPPRTVDAEPLAAASMVESLTPSSSPSESTTAEGCRFQIQMISKRSLKFSVRYTIVVCNILFRFQISWRMCLNWKNIPSDSLWVLHPASLSVIRARRCLRVHRTRAIYFFVAFFH